MKNQTEQKKGYSMKIVVLFLFAVLCVITISLVIKSFFLFRQSKFDFSHRFTIALNTSKSDAVVFSFAPDAKSISKLYVLGSPDTKNLGKTLHIPIDVILISNQPIQLHSENISSQIQELMLQYHSYQSDIPIIDFLKLYLFSKSIPLRSITTDTIKFPQDKNAVDKIVTTLFNDETVSQENSAVEIVNASSVPGLGSRLAKVLSNSGLNIIVVTTSDSPQKKSSITYFIPKNYTVEKLEKFLHYPLIDKSQNITNNETNTADKKVSDIIITIGERDSNNSQF